MMLTKEKCEEALKYFFGNVIDDYPTKLDIKYFEVLENLIEEHFRDKKNLEERFKDY